MVHDFDGRAFVSPRRMADLIGVWGFAKEWVSLCHQTKKIRTRYHIKYDVIDIAVLSVCE